MTAPAPWEIAVKRTPCHAAAATWSRTNAWTGWGDYTVAESYTRLDEEYDAVRRRAGVSDLSPMIKYRIAGRDGEAYLDRLLTRSLGALRVGRMFFSPLCDDRGDVIDFAALHRLAKDDFLLVPGERHLPWLLDSAAAFRNVTVDDVTDDQAVIGVHGIASCAALLLLGARDVDKIDVNESHTFNVSGVAVRIVRTRALGELGYELWLGPEDAPGMWKRLLRDTARLRLRPVGTAAEDVCRVESGTLLPGKDFVSAAALVSRRDARTPYDLGLGRCVDLGKGQFNGKRALVAAARSGPRWAAVGLSVDGDRPVTGAPVLADDAAVGFVTSSVWSPALQQIVALASVAPERARLGTRFEILVTEKTGLEPLARRREAAVAALPFYVSPARNARASGR